MDCPVCGERLKEIDRSGVLIDICPGCKGCWLDRGELDKLLALDAQQAQVVPVNRARSDSPDQGKREYRDDRDDRDHRHDDHDDDKNRSGSSGKRRGSLLGDILGGFGGD
jgi:Zn-finger nucleic acid-binding protein